MSRMHISLIAAAILGLAFSACEDGTTTPGDGTGTGTGTGTGNEIWNQEPKDLLDPAGQQPFQSGSTAEKEIRTAVAAANKRIYANVPVGIGRAVTSLKEHFASSGLDLSALDQITLDNLLPQAPPIPGAGWTATNTSRQASSVGSQRHAILSESELTKFYDCPVLAPEQNAGTDCDQMVEAIVVQVQNSAGQETETIDQSVAEEHPELSAETRGYVVAWAQEALSYGAVLAQIYAKHELRALAACDDKAEAHRVAEALGNEQGWQIVESHRAWAITQVQNCSLVNTDVVAEAVRRESKTEITTFMETNPVCVDADLTKDNEKLVAAEGTRNDGIDAGIDERVEILRVELLSAHDAWVASNCGNDGDGGDGGDGGGGNGDPLVIDLDDDGLTLQTKRIEVDWFDSGTKHSMTWFGASEGILAIDRDGDGEIEGVHELVGCHTDCPDGKLCFDGIAALTSYDRDDRGGNGDGRIDAKDKIFHKLQVWVDENSDGVSQPGELTSLAERGILAFDLTPDVFVRSTPGGTLAGSFQVVTESGFRKVYDVWLKIGMAADDLRFFGPK